MDSLFYGIILWICIPQIPRCPFTHNIGKRICRISLLSDLNLFFFTKGITCVRAFTHPRKTNIWQNNDENQPKHNTACWSLISRCRGNILCIFRPAPLLVLSFNPRQTLSAVRVARGLSLVFLTHYPTYNA